MEVIERTSVLDIESATRIFGRVCGTSSSLLTHAEARASWVHLFASDGAGCEFLSRADWLTREALIQDLNEIWEWDQNVEMENEEAKKER